MKRLLLMLLGAAAASMLLTATLTAQPDGTRLVFVDSQALIAAHPAGQAATDLRIQAQTEVNEVRQQLDDIQNRARAGQPISPEDTERFNILLIALEDLQTRYQAEIAQAAAPAIDAVNAAIAAEAEQHNYSVVLDTGVAAETGLVVYAVDGLDITDAVMLRLGN